MFPATPLQAASTLPLLAAPSLISSAVLPELYQNYKAAGESLGPFFILLLAKRLTLYAAATTSVYVAARRAGTASPGLGARLEQLTAEGLYPFQYPEAEQQELKAVVERLDTTSDATQAATLPLLFGTLLVGAYVFNVVIGAPPPPDPDDAIELFAFAEVLRGAVGTFLPLSTASVCVFALNAELQAFVSALLPPPAADSTSVATNGTVAPAPPPATAAFASFALAVVAVGTAYFVPAAQAWPLQNTINACIAISVGRVLQLPSLPAASAALVGLTLYDGIGTLGTASAAVAVARQVQAVSATLAVVRQHRLRAAPGG